MPKHDFQKSCIFLTISIILAISAALWNNSNENLKKSLKNFRNVLFPNLPLIQFSGNLVTHLHHQFYFPRCILKYLSIRPYMELRPATRSRYICIRNCQIGVRINSYNYAIISVLSYNYSQCQQVLTYIHSWISQFLFYSCVIKLQRGFLKTNKS